MLDNFVRGRRENLALALPSGRVRDRRGRHPRPRARRRADARHRRRLPPGRDPDHAVRRGAAAGARGDGRRHLQRARGGGQRTACRKVVAASSASVYGLAEQFPTAEHHHPYANDTLYGAAKTFNEGLLRSFHAMYGLDYVALRYFNVYGPRMDIHGVYTEVLVRWMERIAAGLPPLILGDGSQTMDFIYIEDIARANVLAASPDVTDEVFNVASGVETSLLELAQKLLERDGLRSRRRVRTRASGQQGTAAAGRHAPRPASGSASTPRSTSTRACVGWSTGGARSASSAAAAGRRGVLADAGSVRAPVPDRRRGRGASPRSIASGWVSQGPRVAGVRGARSPSASARRTRSPRRAARRRCTLLSTPRASAPATR